MSAGGAFGGNRGARPVPPEKGVFPLDHMHECDLEKKEYLACLKTSGHQSERCRQFSKKYLQCRMDRYNFASHYTKSVPPTGLTSWDELSFLALTFYPWNLMAKQDMSELGFGKASEIEVSSEKNDNIEDKDAVSSLPGSKRV